MDRRRILQTWLLMGLMGLASGCAWDKSAVRTTDPDPDAIRAEEDEETRDVAKGFFKKNRLPGTLSSEAAEIEKDLGIYR